MDTQSQSSLQLPTVEEVMKRYNITDPGVGLEMWRLVTLPQRFNAKPPASAESGAVVGILWIGETAFGLGAFEQE